MTDRRDFLRTAAAGVAIAPLAFAQEPVADKPKTVVVGIMGMSRGRDLASDLVKIPGVRIKYACDTDNTRAESAAKFLNGLGQDSSPVQDFRRILDDKEVDALICSAPNHWHGPATILGCKAGKHVYVEKPCSHNPAEGEWMVAAAEKYGRLVQVGTQRRSAPEIQAAMAKLAKGAIGKVYLARAFFSRFRGPIGHADPTSPPPYLDYELWQGPAPKRPYKQNVVHYNWHWFWHWGNGELGNNGIHVLDVCRWGLGVDYPTRVVSSGGRYLHKDDQETPDTHSVAFEFPDDKQISYQGLSGTQHELGPFASFYGTEGALEIDGNGFYKIYNAKNELVEDVKGSGWGQLQHLTNFVESVQANDASKLNQPILEGHKSTLLCHLGNIAHRTARAVTTDPSNGRILHDKEQQGLWRREYDPAWEKEIVS